MGFQSVSLIRVSNVGLYPLLIKDHFPKLGGSQSNRYNNSISAMKNHIVKNYR